MRKLHLRHASIEARFNKIEEVHPFFYITLAVVQNEVYYFIKYSASVLLFVARYFLLNSCYILSVIHLFVTRYSLLFIFSIYVSLSNLSPIMIYSTYCVCVKHITLCSYLCSSSSRFSGSCIRVFGIVNPYS